MRALKMTTRIFLLVVALIGASSVWAASLDDIRFAELPGERFEIRMAFSEVPPEPTGYTIEKPARIVLDFPNVDNLLAEKKFALSFHNAKSAVVLGANGRSRLILNLEQLSNYSTRRDGNVYVVEVGNVQVGEYHEQSDSMSEVVASEQQTTGAAVASIDFRRGAQGEGKLIIGLSDANVSADIDKVGEGISVSLPNVWLPQDLRRRLDVMDFATPVSIVDALYESSGTSINIDANGEYDYLAYQVDEEFIISVKPLSEQELEERNAKFAFVGEKLSLNFQDIEVRAVLQLIAEFTDLNLVASDTVSGKITLRLENVPWDQALDLVLKTKGLDKRQIGNVLMVAPAAEIADRERQQLESQKQLQELAPLVTEYIRIRYADAQNLYDMVQKSSSGVGSRGSRNSGESSSLSGGIISDRGRMIVDSRTNSIILTDTQERVDSFKNLVEKIDIPVRQVMIEARIVIANTDFRKEMGVRWGLAGAQRSGSRNTFDPETGQQLFATADGEVTTRPQEEDGTRNSPVVRSRQVAEICGSFDCLDDEPGDPSSYFFGDGVMDIGENLVTDLGVVDAAGNLAMSFIKDNTNITLELSALESSGYAEIVSQPKVITGDKQEASILSGTEIPYQEATASGATSTSFKKAVLELNVIPQITPDNRIIMDLKINQDSRGEETGAGVPTLEVTQLESQVLVGNGQTVVLGGIFQTETVTGTTKVPVLGDIPYLGRLFKKDLKDNKKRELLIFITPKILADSIAN